MSAVVDDSPVTIDVTRTPTVPFGRLVSIELRKLFDTLAGRWLVGITLGILVVAVVIVVLVAASDDEFTMSLYDWQGMLTFLMSLLLPAIAVTSITQEWGQRTGLTTFALEPRRDRVIAAKLTAVVLLALGTLVFATALAALGNIAVGAVGGQDVSWSIKGPELGWNLAIQMAYFLMAFGMGMVFLSTPGAIVAYYVVALVLPQIVYGAIYVLVSWGPKVIPWLDMRFAVAAYRDEMPPAEGAVPDFGIGPVLFSFALWVVVPFVVGLWRIRRIELK
jgi:hypothetical protein